MKDFIVQSLASLGTGLVTGVFFAFLKLPVPAPPVLPAVFGIFGITIGYILFQKLFGA